MSEELKRGIPKATVIGKNHPTEEERKKYDKDFEKLLKEDGILKKDETIEDLKKK